MQQVFYHLPLSIGDEILFDANQEHHFRVLRVKKEIIRIVYNNDAYFGEVSFTNNHYQAKVIEKDDSVKELSSNITLYAAIIDKVPYELVLQKATELGTSSIVPLETSRCVKKIDQAKWNRIKERWQSIILASAQQCKRNVVPELNDPIKLPQLAQCTDDIKLVAYENKTTTSISLSSVYKPNSSIAVVIGPEGGFTEEEIKQLNDYGFQCVTFGSRILRTETSSIYALSVLSELDLRQGQ